ncbi:MAG: M48 family metalloprotease [Eubacteriaceae bacterium]|nr:M48 family metalloprotease [Eubacteriaceae bacterium]
MKLARFLKANSTYVLWFLYNHILMSIILRGGRRSFIAAFFLLAISLAISLSSFGEVALRAMQGAKELQAHHGQASILSLYDAVITGAIGTEKGGRRIPKLYIIDSGRLNSLAVGKETIILTRGIVDNYDADEIQGIIAHELGHLQYAHSRALLVAMSGNLLFSLIIFMARVVLAFVDGVAEAAEGSKTAGELSKAVSLACRLAFELAVFLFVNVGETILAVDSKDSELVADLFAHEIGFGRGLAKSLYRLSKIDAATKKGFGEMFKIPQAHILSRIANLERLEAAEKAKMEEAEVEVEVI